MPSHTFLYGGQARIRTLEADGSRFTVCPLCPLGYLPFQQLNRLAVPSCINNTLRERGKRGYKTEPNFSCRNRQKRASRVFPFKNRKGRPHQTENYIETPSTRQETKSKARAAANGHNIATVLHSWLNGFCLLTIRRVSQLEATLSLVDKLFREPLAWPSWHNRNQHHGFPTRGYGYST